MELINTIAWLARMACFNALFLYPAAVLLSLAVLFGLLSWRSWWNSSSRSCVLLLAAPSLGTVMILICGALFQCGDQRPCMNEALTPAAVALILCFLLLEISLILWTVSQLPKIKIVAVILGALQFWYTLLAAGMAHMSVTGVWM